MDDDDGDRARADHDEMVQLARALYALARDSNFQPEN